MPSREDRIKEMQKCLFGSGQHVCSADLHRKSEVMKKAKFQKLVELIDKFAPEGKWLDIGCGTGTLVSEAQKANKEVAGIELTPDRRRLAKELSGAEIYDKPIEVLNLAPESYAVVTMTDVFSHLTSPSETFSCVHKVLRKNGIMMLYTSEVGPGVRRYHNYFWELGDHLYFLGEHTIERYCGKIGFELIHREKRWIPDFLFSRETFLKSGRSKLRNFIKKACVYSPGVLPLLRWYMLKIRHKGNPCYASTLLLKKVDK
jgi:2-polyprenyl-3-methyl-5-hydroxy-6-metoxy-1,4-benzoquinol methylase